MIESAEPANAQTAAGTGRRRALTAIGLAVVVAVGLVIHAWGPAGAFGDVAGDALYAGAAYLAVALLMPRLSPPAVGAIAFGCCLAVELFQLTGLPLAWGAAVPALKLVLGTGFDARDVLVYAAGVGAAVLIDAGATRAVRADRRRTGHR